MGYNFFFFYYLSLQVLSKAFTHFRSSASKKKYSKSNERLYLIKQLHIFIIKLKTLQELMGRKNWHFECCERETFPLIVLSFQE